MSSLNKVCVFIFFISIYQVCSQSCNFRKHPSQIEGFYIINDFMTYDEKTNKIISGNFTTNDTIYFFENKVLQVVSSFKFTKIGKEETKFFKQIDGYNFIDLDKKIVAFLDPSIDKLKIIEKKALNKNQKFTNGWSFYYNNDDESCSCIRNNIQFSLSDSNKFYVDTCMINPKKDRILYQKKIYFNYNETNNGPIHLDNKVDDLTNLRAYRIDKKLLNDTSNFWATVILKSSPKDYKLNNSTKQLIDKISKFLE